MCLPRRPAASGIFSALRILRTYFLEVLKRFISDKHLREIFWFFLQKNSILVGKKINCCDNLIKVSYLEMTTDDKTRPNSTSTTQPGGRYYYPTAEELVHADAERFKHLTEKLTNGWNLRLLKGTIGNLRQAKSSIHTLTKVDDKIDNLKNEIFAKRDDLKIESMGINEKLISESDTKSSAVPSRHTKKPHEPNGRRIRIRRMPEVKSENESQVLEKDLSQVNDVLMTHKQSNVSAKNVFRAVETTEANPNRTLIVRFDSPWSTREINLKPHHWRYTNTISTSLEKCQIRKFRLRTQYWSRDEVLSCGIDRRRTKIKGKKLFLDEEDVSFWQTVR